jgi:hypothetical protein
MRMTEQTAVADRVRAKFDAYQARPWRRSLARLRMIGPGK